MKIILISIAITLLSLQTISAQTAKEVEQLVNWRLSRIDIHNIGFGSSVGMNENILISPHLYYRAGSHHNLLNAETGLKYTYFTSADSLNKDIISGQYLGVYTDAHLNFFRWKTGALYLGVGIEYNLGIKASYRAYNTKDILYDNNIIKNHTSTKGKIGFRINRWDASFYIDYNLAPIMNQKHVFESINFEYEQVYNQLHERYRIGISLSYMIPL